MAKKTSRAILKIGIDALKSQRRRIAPEANLAKVLGSQLPAHTGALEHYEDLGKVIDLLQAVLEDPDLLKTAARIIGS